ncbi:MAG TPA: DUF58 domain-containing protein [Patescibacteria group bacterium]|jgi:uncharacterized protein (DUF58 family)|nr:DUF58 domain-containing protein [Patescibacteria group bacterium]
MTSEITKLSPDIIEKIKQINLFTKRLLRNQMLGASRSSTKGMGFDFEALRDYAIGDDIRFVDWRASSRASSLLVREFRQDQLKTVLLVVDISRSLTFGTKEQKKDLVNRIAAIIGLISHYSQDLVSLILFSETVELYLPPKRTKNYINVIMKAIFSWEPKGIKTNSSILHAYLSKAALKKALVFWFSDCIDAQFEQIIKFLPRTHDIYVMRCLNELEQTLPAIGCLTIQDLESNQYGYVTITQAHAAWLQKRILLQEQIIKKAGVKTIDITDTSTALQKIISLFRTRMRV